MVIYERDFMKPGFSQNLVSGIVYSSQTARRRWVMRSLNNILFTGALMVLGILIGGCAGEIATYRLAKEGSEAYNASDYSTALEKWQAGLEQARKEMTEIPPPD